LKIQNPQGIAAERGSLLVRTSEQPVQRPAEKQANSADGDALDLSLSSRVSELSSLVASGLPDGPADLTSERLTEIQSRLASGLYGHPKTAELTAGQMLDFYGR
jgi:hypothetical protein